jgi:hypothetical protein
MSRYATWILEAALGERSWLYPNATGKGGVGIVLTNKNVRLVTTTNSLYENKII